MTCYSFWGEFFRVFFFLFFGLECVCSILVGSNFVTTPMNNDFSTAMIFPKIVFNGQLWFQTFNLLHSGMNKDKSLSHNTIISLQKWKTFKWNSISMPSWVFALNVDATKNHSKNSWKKLGKEMQIVKRTKALVPFGTKLFAGKLERHSAWKSQRNGWIVFKLRQTLSNFLFSLKMFKQKTSIKEMW